MHHFRNIVDYFKGAGRVRSTSIAMSMTVCQNVALPKLLWWHWGDKTYCLIFFAVHVSQIQIW